MGADTAGHIARNAVTAAANQNATFPRTGFLLNTQGNQGTAARIMPGRAGTRGFMNSAPRTLGFGSVSAIAMTNSVGVQPTINPVTGAQEVNPPPPPGTQLL